MTLIILHEIFIYHELIDFLLNLILFMINYLNDYLVYLMLLIFISMVMEYFLYHMVIIYLIVSFLLRMIMMRYGNLFQ